MARIGVELADDIKVARTPKAGRKTVVISPYLLQKTWVLAKEKTGLT